MRGLSKWQLSILTVAGRGGERLIRKLPNRKSTTLERVMKPLVPHDAALCSDGAGSAATERLL